MKSMTRIRIIGVVLVVAGLVVAAVGFFYAMPLASDGLDSAQAVYEQQGVTLSYDEQGRLLDRGTPEGAQAILAMLRDEWNYPIDHDNLDPDDPLVNTRDELMYQYAVITWHVLHGTAAVTLTEEHVPISYRGVAYTEPGTYDIEVGAYYAQLDRTHPIEGQLRAAWSPLALSLLAALSSGHANQAAGEIAWYVGLGAGGIGLLFAVAGAGAIWVSLPPASQDETHPPHKGQRPLASPRGQGQHRDAAKVAAEPKPPRGPAS